MENEPEGIGPAGDQAGRQECMSVPAGSAPVPFYLDLMDGRMVILYFYQIAVIMGKSRQASLCASMRTGGITNAETGSFLFKPLMIGKRDLI